MNEKNLLSFEQRILEKNIVSQERLDAALKRQAETGEDLGAVLWERGWVEDDAAFLPLYAEYLGVSYVLLRDMEIPREVIEKIPPKFAGHYRVLPVRFQEGVLTIATAKPYDICALDEIGLVVSASLNPVLASGKDITEAIRRYYGVGAETIERMMDSVMPPASAAPEVTDIEEIDSEASIGKFLNQILLEAYKDRATDIHLEPFEDTLQIRYRVDGMLQDAKVPRNIKHFKDSIVSRIKILSNLNIAEKRMPQDGRFKVRVGRQTSADSTSGVDLDLRVSFLPTPYGESAVLRILNAARLYSFEELGLSASEKTLLQRLIVKPHGIIFLTGPTGSGKTTTLYSCLSSMNTEEKKIVTIEDPIEYQLKGITQIQINPAIGLTFAHGLRSMLRHDPDVMMVGEVRDIETAEIAIRVALTGHLVFSTLHTNDAASGITRLLDMGVEPYLITSTVECFIAQRLVRVLCSRCKSPVTLTPLTARDFGLALSAEPQTIYESKGCEACRFTGYAGREAIYEFLVLNEDIRALIMERAASGRIKEKAAAGGMKTLRQAGWEKIQKGITSAQELIRVIQEE